MLTIDLTALNGGNGFRLSGAASSDDSGKAVASAGDVNGDGFGDMIIGAPYADPNGASYLVFGRATGFAANLDLSTLNGTNGFKLSETTSFGNSSSVASAGDVNGDGYADLIIGAPSASTSSGYYSGVSYLVFGKGTGFSANLDLSSLDGSNGVTIGGADGGDFSGSSVASAGDVNGDGFADLIVGARFADAHGDRSGASYVVFGKASGFAATLDLSAVNGRNGFRLSGVAASDESGRSVSAAGDVNGDGFADLIIGSRFADPHGQESGASYVVFGKASSFGANLDLSALNGSNGFRLSGANEGDQSGYSVSSAGDVNGDGFADVVVGAPLADAPGSNYGAAYVVFGRASGFAANLNLSTLNGANGFKLTGAGLFSQAGRSVSTAGDVNADGFADLIVGGTGASYVVFGRKSGFAANIDLARPDASTTVLRLQGASTSGNSVASAGDVNGDGLADLLVGAPDVGPSGTSYVVFGFAPKPGQQTPYFIDALRFAEPELVRYNWNAKDGAPVKVTYSFMSSVPTGYPTSVEGKNPFTTFLPFDDTLKAAARHALRAWQQVSGLSFVEISAADEAAGHRGMIQFGRHAMTSSGYALAPTFAKGVLVPAQFGGVVFIERSLTGVASSFDYLLRHEIGHALGLKHPFEKGAVLPASEDNRTNTVMSYTGAALADHPLGLFDIAAIQQIYGVNPLVRSGADTYAFGAQRYVWDGGGVDTITAAAMAQTVYLSLLPGTWSYGGVAAAKSILSASQLFVGYGTAIEKAVGSAFGDTLVGNDGTNSLDGGAGVDTVRYEWATAGISVSLQVTGPQNTGGAGSDTLIRIENLAGSSFADTLIGNAGVNVLSGGGGNDTLQGRGGKDTLDGNAGDDTADFRDKTAAVALTLAAAGNARVKVDGVVEDTIRNIENVYGGSGNDTLVGDGLANKLSGMAGNDILRGGSGKDELDGGTGNDWAYYSDKTAAVTVTLAGAADVKVKVGGVAEDTIRKFENVRGGSGNDTLVGDGLANKLSGMAGNDILRGGAGNDVLNGGIGNDKLVFDTGLNALTNVDTITDFNVANDTIHLENSIFNAIAGTGILTGVQFRANASGLAADGDDRIVYENDTGKLFYDGNGNAAGGRVQFAELSAGLALTASDFFVT